MRCGSGAHGLGGLPQSSSPCSPHQPRIATISATELVDRTLPGVGALRHHPAQRACADGAPARTCTCAAAWRVTRAASTDRGLSATRSGGSGYACPPAKCAPTWSSAATPRPAPRRAPAPRREPWCPRSGRGSPGKTSRGLNGASRSPPLCLVPAVTVAQVASRAVGHAAPLGRKLSGSRAGSARSDGTCLLGRQVRARLACRSGEVRCGFGAMAVP